MVPTNYPKIVMRLPGPGTCTGSGDILIDSNGKRYRQVGEHEAQMIRSSTAGMVYGLYPDGTIR